MMLGNRNYRPKTASYPSPITVSEDTSSYHIVQSPAKWLDAMNMITHGQNTFHLLDFCLTSNPGILVIETHH